MQITPQSCNRFFGDLNRIKWATNDLYKLIPFDPERPTLNKAVCSQVEIRLKYEGYIRRQLKQIEEFARMEDRPLPADIDYSQVTGLRLEAREKLSRIRPENFGRASRISGVSPADISVLMIYTEQNR